MTEEKKGIQETKELLYAVNLLALLLVKQFKDGVQFSDFLEMYTKIVSNEAFKQGMLDAYMGVKKIPEEMKDLDVKEIIDLTSLQLSFIPNIIDVLKKKPDDPT